MVLPVALGHLPQPTCVGLRYGRSHNLLLELFLEAWNLRSSPG